MKDTSIINKIVKLANKYSRHTSKSYDISVIKAHSYYGAPELTLDEIGQIFSITRERVRQIESRSKSMLMHPKTGRKLRDYME